MKQFSSKKILSYIYNKITGTFAGFVIGMAATSLVSRFFETRSLKNLWGFTAKHKVIDKKTYSHVEWLISIIIGFIVFEIMTKVIKKKLDEHFPRYKIGFLRWIILHNIHRKLRKLRWHMNERKVNLMATRYTGTKSAFHHSSGKTNS